MQFPRALFASLMFLQFQGSLILLIFSPLFVKSFAPQILLLRFALALLRLLCDSILLGFLFRLFAPQILGFPLLVTLFGGLSSLRLGLLA
jgi:hypothetical protein